MGQLDQFAKDTFAVEAASVTRGGVSWQLPPELGMSEVRLDGLLRVHEPSLLTKLAAPWSLVDRADEIALEGIPIEDLDDTESTFSTSDADFDEKFVLIKLIALLEAQAFAGPSKLKADPDRLSKVVEEVCKIQDEEPATGFEAALAALVTLAPKFG